MRIRFFNIADFVKTDLKYNVSLYNPNVRYSKYRNTIRLIYNIPTGERCFYYLKQTQCNEDIFNRVIDEFNYLLKQGYLPLSALKDKPLEQKLTSINTAIDLYYSVFNTGKRTKQPNTIHNERLVIVLMFSKFLPDKKNIEELTSKDLIKLNADIEGQTYSIATIKSYKKIFKAFLNCLVENDFINPLICNPAKINMNTFDRGVCMKAARLVHVPQEILSNIKNVDFKNPNYLPDMKRLIMLASETGLRKQELLTLSTHNLIPSPDNFTHIKIMDKADCPMPWGMGFKVKSINSTRTIPLSHNSPRLRNYQRLITTERCLVKDFKESYRSAQVPKSVKVAPNNYVTLRQLNFQVCANRVCKWPGSPMGCPAFFYSKLKGGRRNES